MNSPKDRLDRALLTFRRDQAFVYLQRLAGTPLAEQRGQRARAFLTSEAGFELVDATLASGELPPHEASAVCAHLARAHAELAYARARALSPMEQQVDVEGDTRPLSALLGEWLDEPHPLRRSRLERSADRLLGAHAEQLIDRRQRADHAVSRALARLPNQRHPDAGPERGTVELAEQWLTLTQELAGEVFAHARRAARVEGEAGLDTLWATLGTPMRGLFRGEGRYRRLADELAPLGLRRQLAQAARLAQPHPGPFPAPHVLVAAAPREIRVCPSQVEVGLASELLAADALGRAMAHAHASPALPVALRHASAGSLARTAGALTTLRFLEPQFLRKRRGLSGREAEEVARLAAGFMLVDSRLAAAALLARGLNDADPQPRAQALCERALRGPVPPGCASFLLIRLSPGPSFRGKSWAPALAHAMRERFDADWYENPRAGEPLRGAFARAGDFSVEGFAEELSARIERGPEKLSELF